MSNTELQLHARELKAQFEISQSVTNSLTDTERSQELLKAIVIHKIEKELPEFKKIQSLKERQKYLEPFINEYVSNFDTLRKLF